MSRKKKLHLTTQERKRFEGDLAAAEPYTYEEMMESDTPRDPARVRATVAKKFLEEDAQQILAER